MSDHRLIVIYDGHCVLCTRTVSRLMKLRTTSSIESMPLQDNRVVTLLPVDYDRDQLDKEIHVMDMSNGRIIRGADAIVYIMTKLPSLRLVSFMYHVPGMKWVASRIYRWIAKRRYDLFGKTDECDSGYCSIK